MKDNAPGLFESQESERSVRTVEIRWLLVSNHVNLLTMLSAGLILPPKGFCTTYFQDSLNSFPGWIPLFAGAVPQKAVDDSINEESYLLPCIASIKLAGLQGQLIALYKEGTQRSISFPDGLDGTEVAIFVPAPLPTAWIEKIMFRTREDKQKCESFSKNSSNLPLELFKRELDAKLFSKTSQLAWPPQITLNNRDRSPDLSLAVGGMIALLYQLANRIGQATSACRIAFECGETESINTADPFEQTFSSWLKSAEPLHTADLGLRLFWKVVSRIALFRSSQVSERNYFDLVLELLESEKIDLEKAMQEHLIKLIDDLRSIVGLADKTMTELFKRHPKYFSRSLILFFLREKSGTLLEMRHPELKESDYIAASILFAAREGWIALPLELRGTPDMQTAVSHRMAAHAHRFSDTGIDLGPAPSRCVPLHEFFATESKGWGLKQKDAALNLARECKWDCIHTKISIGKGDYHLVIESGAAHILIPGEVKSVTTEVDTASFMQKLSETVIPSELDQKIRLSASKGAR